MYTVNPHSLNVFNITNPENPTYLNQIYMGNWFAGELETIFKQKDFLFIGATNGMHIVNALDEFNPQYISSFNHATACDPVVVNQNSAYITVRGGATCGAIEDQVNVIDIADINNPVLLSTYLLQEPYGLGYHNNTLYVCNSDGLNTFDATGSNLTLEQTYLLNNAKDVIALPSHLIVVGENVVYQYDYTTNFELTLISEFEF